MTACDRRCTPVALPHGWGTATLHSSAHAPATPSTRRSYDALGRQLVWRPPPGNRHACDLELAHAEAPALARRFQCDPRDLALRWILTETLAKLADRPVLVHLRDRGLEPARGAADGQILRCEGGAIEVLLRRVSTMHGEALSAFGRVASSPLAG